ncbi:MAG TPA: hypothetical protein DHW82_09550 [Spirochaetia bacterium]|nr:MAG: hypothetical protein A2Y41_01950 [Spirochaetes bacterium GWB1_36_13]HCL57235.1 hypothetical protein [Spirochaetia bacterium]
MKKKENSQIKHLKSPVIYPMGFGLGADIENRIIIIDFIEQSEIKQDGVEEIFVSGSYAIPLQKAKKLLKNIENIIKDMEKNEK